MLLDRLLARLSALRLDRAYARRSFARHAPYPTELYRSIIRQAKKQGLPLGTFDDPVPVAHSTRIFFRHDIDYANCVSGAAAMIEINLEERAPVAAFLRTDGEAYHPNVARELVREYRARGVTFGLHTSCYTEEDYLSALARERVRFAESFGFEAKTFTVHGLGELHLQRRLAFTAHAAAHLAELGFDYSDCTAGLRPYHLVFQDCEVDPSTGARAMFDTTEVLPALLRHGHNYLILTHPSYWVEK